MSDPSPEMDCSIAVVFLALMIAVTHSASTPEEYWKTMLPNTPLPGAIRDLFRPDVGVDVKALAYGGYKVTAFGNYAYSNYIESEKHALPDHAIFLLEKDLLPGSKLRLDFTRSAPTVAFLPRGEAEAIPFATRKIPAILNHFSVQPSSAIAKGMKETLGWCEMKDPAAESSYCATSLESMVDYATLVLRTHDVQAVSSVVAKEGVPKQDYVIPSSPRMKIAADEVVACHPLPYPYSVFYCHILPATKAYVVPLVGKNGVKVDAVAVCHTDTSAWNPKHLALMMTNVKPGTVPICHFLPPGALVWAPHR